MGTEYMQLKKSSSVKIKEKEVTFKLNFISCATFFLDTYLVSFVVYELSAHISFNSFGVE